MVDRSIKVLVTSSAAKVPLIKALQSAAQRLNPSATIIAGDSSEPVISQYFADVFWQMPPCKIESSDEILTGLTHYGITHILPSRDGELFFWAQLTAKLIKKNIKVIVPSTSAINLCLDKLIFSSRCNKLKLPVIPSLLSPNNSSDLWVVKERFGAGSKTLGLALTPEQALQHAKNLQSPIFQPYIAGSEISIDAWLDKNGKLKAHIYRYRIKVQHGESQISQTVSLPQFDDIVRAVLEDIGLTGPVVLQAIIDQYNTLHIIECNSRFGGASTLGIKAGVDSLYWSLAESIGIDVSTLPFKPEATPITQIRYAGDMYL